MKYCEISIDNDSEDFISRVMKENLWSREYTLRVIEEYKKFIWLSTIMYVSPSHQIDQVWHTHILYTKDYTEMCMKLKGKYIHHNPTSSKEKSERKADPYFDTLRKYEDYFGSVPEDIWRLKASHYVYLDINQLWVIPTGDWKALLKVLFKHIKFKIYGIF